MKTTSGWERIEDRNHFRASKCRTKAFGAWCEKGLFVFERAPKAAAAPIENLNMVYRPQWQVPGGDAGRVTSWNRRHMFAARITTPIPRWVLVDFFRRSGQSDLRIEADDPVHWWVRSALNANVDQDVCVVKPQHTNVRNLGQPDWFVQWGGGHVEVVKWNPHRNR